MKKFLSIVFFIGIAILGWNKSRDQEVLDATTGDKQVPHVIAASAGLWTLPRARSISSLGNVDKTLGRTPHEIAEDYFNNHREEWHIQDYHHFRSRDVITPEETTVTYRAYQDDYPLIGMKIDIHVGKNLEVTAVENTYRPVRKADFSHESFLSTEEVLERIPAGFVADNNTALRAASVLFVSPGAEEPELAYTMHFKEDGQPPARFSFFCERRTGKCSRSLEIDINWDRSQNKNTNNNNAGASYAKQYVYKNTLEVLGLIP